MKKHSRCNTARKILIFWCLFIGLGAVAGSFGMLTAPDGSNLGMQSMLPYFQVLPFSKYLFQDFIFPGISLLIVNGITNLVAATLLLAKKKAGIICGGIFGVTLMLWICIQFVIFPLNFMSTIYFIFGFLQAVTGYAAWVFCCQESFKVDENKYTNISSNKNELVVYFSRMGYTKQIAYETADKSGADIYEIKSTELTDGTKGFWWCGRYGMHKWEMPIEKIGINLSAYSKVTVCSPIWVFNLAAPTRSFCKQASGKIKSADYIIVHHQKSRYSNAFEEMDSLLNIKHNNDKSICCRKGKFIKEM